MRLCRPSKSCNLTEFNKNLRRVQLTSKDLQLLQEPTNNHNPHDSFGANVGQDCNLYYLSSGILISTPRFLSRSSGSQTTINPFPSGFRKLDKTMRILQPRTAESVAASMRSLRKHIPFIGALQVRALTRVNVT